MDKLPVDIATAECLRLGGDEIVVLATSEATDGALFAVLVRMPPGGGPPVMHRHAPGEVYHVLTGEFAFSIADDDGRVTRTTATAGEVMPLAGGTPHTIRNETGVAAEAFVVHAPGAPMEGFSRAVAALAAEREPTMDAVLTVAAQNGIELLGPVPEVTASV
ncbi:cupin domain-containing protein [Actinomycetospora sp. NBRC 106375]|uniref:cupin domain-containing protein n=1 Tax=Actinomycetospora sp. NBRC 106375 TaxID=3032207 RepID=UPI0025522DA9|nr:cupin domain-containing protein [Actinomycetospora sp. NBRC 106375]